VYPLDAIYGAAYELLDRAYVFLASAGRGAVVVELRAKRSVEAAVDLEELAGELGNRLLDHALRVSIARRHGRLREMIVAKALAGAGAGGDQAEPPSPAVATPATTEITEDPFEVAAEWQAGRKPRPARR
jgi:His-Xaa-Ser system protein HxsD